MNPVCARVRVEGSISWVCSREMTCVKTGMKVLVHDHYGFGGDIYACPECGSRVCITSSEGLDSGTEPYARDKWTIDLKD